ncbi:hypothetical protein JOD57_000823 [Geodermatophilus bullaregiensis]|uniref:hypothetical protein n=1 Tax=Geodermatophilus bullaregiensis TaxID=1564160 RepID=UPI0019586D0D|nr:hypothetical protein [Geodermatophilus bullaregiensis]MBM7804986.1 hypothetical protein [Geodermatophilus bullaregiensis]
MAEALGATLAIVLIVGGMALVVYAGYLYYVALPGEHAPRHVITRTALAVVGAGLVLLGTGLLR